MRLLQPEDNPTADLTSKQLARKADRGQLRRLWRGVYLDLEGTCWDSLRLETRHAVRTAGYALAAKSAVICGVSAAVMHRLPLLHSRLTGDISVNRKGYGSPPPGVSIHRSVLAPNEVVSVQGLAVTSLERTVQDLAGVLHPRELLAVADAALRLGADFSNLDAPLRSRRRLKWVRAHASGRAESYAESWSRYLMLQHAVPMPWQQVSVYDDDGMFVARSDFGSSIGVLGEFDGKNKYRQFLRPGETADDVVAAEKARENRLRELGWDVVRWQWEDLVTPQKLLRLLRKGFERAGHLPKPNGFVRLEPMRPIKPVPWKFLPTR